MMSFADDDSFEDWSDDDSDALDEFDEEEDSTATTPCPACGIEIYEDAERCPHCGEYVVHGHSPWSGRPLWWIVLGLAGMAALAAWLSGLL